VANDLRSDELDRAITQFTSASRIACLGGNVFDLDPRSVGAFDLVIACEVIEHVAHPDELLRTLARFVAPDGAILLTTPNGRYFRNQLPTFAQIGDPTQLEANQFKPDADGHLFLLTPGELTAMAADAGLQVEHILLWGTPFLSGGAGLRLLKGAASESSLLLAGAVRPTAAGVDACSTHQFDFRASSTSRRRPRIPETEVTRLRYPMGTPRDGPRVSLMRDVLIIGGGPGGLETARLLAGDGFDVAVLRGAPHQRRPGALHGRAGRRSVRSTRPLPRRHSQPSQHGAVLCAVGASVEHTTLDTEAVVVDRLALDRALFNGARQAGATVVTGCRVSGARVEERGVAVSLNDGTTVWGRACVLACGAQYAIQRRLGMGLPAVFLQSAQMELPAARLGDVEVRFGRQVAPAASPGRYRSSVPRVPTPGSD
jgi:hypothetical protein